MSGLDRPSRAIERGKAVAFKLAAREEKELVEQQGVILKNKSVDVARLHHVIKVQGAEIAYEAEVVAIQEPSSGEDGKVNYVLSFVRRLNHNK